LSKIVVVVRIPIGNANEATVEKSYEDTADYRVNLFNNERGELIIERIFVGNKADAKDYFAWKKEQKDNETIAVFKEWDYWEMVNA
jgi:hypothetical protein